MTTKNIRQPNNKAKTIGLENITKDSKEDNESGALLWLEDHIWIPLCRVGYFIKDKYLRTKWFYQRGRYGYADCDLWSIDSYLADWLPEALRKFKANKSGYPCKCHLKTKKNRSKNEKCQCQEKWDKNLDIMIEGFKVAKQIADGELTMDTFKIDPKLSDKINKKAKIKFQKAMEVFSENFFNLWD